MLLNGRGGHLEQTYLYLDPSSAAAWCSIAEQEDYDRLTHADANGSRGRADFRASWTRSGSM
jgi:hypothetical protein